MDRRTILEKAELTLNDLSTDGGILLPEQANTFIRTMQDQPTIMNQARVITMSSPKQNVDKIKFGSRVLQPASQDRSANTAVHAGRKLKVASKVTTDQIQLDTVEVMAKVPIGYEILEDNIERGNFQETLLTLLAARCALDLEELFIQGDTGNVSDPYLALLDGILVQATQHEVDAAGDPYDLDLLTDMEIALPQQYRSLPDLRTWATSNAETKLRTTIASRNTGLGDSMVMGKAPLTPLSHPFQGVHKMPTGFSLLTSPRNIIIGVQRKMRLEVDRDIESRELLFVMTARVDMKIEEVDAVVKGKNFAY